MSEQVRTQLSTVKGTHEPITPLNPPILMPLQPNPIKSADYPTDYGLDRLRRLASAQTPPDTSALDK